MNSSEKFYDTYGKNVSFENAPTHKSIEAEETVYKTSRWEILKKYVVIALFILAAVTFLIFGGFFILIFLGIGLVVLVLRSLFPSSASQTHFIIKK